MNPSYAPVNAPMVDRDTLHITVPWRNWATNPEVGLGGGGIEELTGDVSATGPGIALATLASTGVTPGSYTSTNLTIDVKGRITAAANGSGGSSTLEDVLTVDPVAPADDKAWFFRDGGTPETLSVRVRRAGVTYDFPVGTFP